MRGLDHVPESQNFEGRFGRMFRHLKPALHLEDDLKALGTAMTADADKPTPETKNPRDDEENTGISAGYTYFGQFIDHDLTFDPSTLAQQKSDPEAIVDFRTPRFDLDNLYGRGPDDQPYLYDFQDDGTIKMQLGDPLTGNSNDPDTRDLPRRGQGDPQFALIGDKRNDENVIVSQLQGIFLRFHNRMLNVHKQKGLPTDFDSVRKVVQFHYQWVVVHDFLPTIIGWDMLHRIFPHIGAQSSILEYKPRLRFYHPKKDPFMPVEFSVAAYRFGHSMVRPLYRLNERDDLSSHPHDPRPHIFPDLKAFGKFRSDYAIDWRLFFDFGNDAEPFSKERIQPAYKIDTSLVSPLRHLPAPITGEQPPSLAQLNLRRGLKLKLPSGQDVARAMGVPVIPDELLRVGKANEDGQGDGSLEKPGTNQSILSISENFRDNAPLWFYILAEAQQQYVDDDTPICLGPVGGRIVGETFAGLLFGDKNSFLHTPGWHPYPEFLSNGEFGIPQLISQAMLSEK
ncbi:peroxidase family protein [Nostoc sp. PA-18-2419]|uniref:peroxidase family protein n=1 Tax=Nostoc sp. PA-18-2419 TaxID=2575443 RepID=UPI0016755941|nr:heme peroxidase family protein [Nostoc sp. PA-18-2419]